MNLVSAIIAHRSVLIRKGLRHLLEEQQLCNVLAEVEGVQELESALNTNTPDLVFADPDLLNEEVFAQLENLPCPALSSARLIAISGKGLENLPKHFDTGIDSNARPEHIFEAIRDLGSEAASNQNGNEDQLSEREIIVLHEIVLGQTNKEVGDKLFISTHTVITHRKNITRKLGIRTVSGLTVYAIMNGIVSMEDIQTADNKRNDDED